MVRSPVLLLVYNRVDFAAKTARVVVQQRPPRLYVASDGPRDRSEAVVVAQAREAVLAAAGGEVEVVTLFRDAHLGCKRAVEQAISWFLSQESEGIILEDDCVPDPTFFTFCDAMLECHRDNPRVMHVSGFSPTTSSLHGYRYSQFPSAWGWATWARAWSSYDDRLPDAEVIERRELRSAFATDFEHRFFVDTFRRVNSGQLDSWAYAWLYAVTSRQGLTIRPTRNLVANVGVGDARATHTRRHRAHVNEGAAVAIDLRMLRHPLLALPDFDADRDYFRLMIAGRHARTRRLVKSVLSRVSPVLHATRRHLVARRRG